MVGRLDEKGDSPFGWTNEEWDAVHARKQEMVREAESLWKHWVDKSDETARQRASALVSYTTLTVHAEYWRRWIRERREASRN